MSDFLDTILDISEIYDKYGLKGCVLISLAIVVLIAAIVVLASFLG